MSKSNSASTSKSTSASTSAPAEVRTEVEVVLGKYAGKTIKLGGVGIIPKFKYSDHELFCNTAANTAPQKATTVMGKVYGMVKANPGITGHQLVVLMRKARWEGHPTKYTTGGEVCPLWCIGYIVGAAGNKLRHIVARQAVREAKAE